MAKKYLIYILVLIFHLMSPGLANAFDIVPDPALFEGGRNTAIVGKDANAIHWNLWDVNATKYRGKGILVWAFVPDRNPIPRKNSAEIAWHKQQLTGVLSALGDSKIEWTRVLQGPDVLASNTQPPDPVALYNYKLKGFDLLSSQVYVVPVAKGRGRLIAFVLSDIGWLEEATLDFVRLWGERLKNFDPKDTP